MELSEDDVRRVLTWARGCDGESFIDEEDWPLIVRLAASVGEDPSHYAQGCEPISPRETRALFAFEQLHGHWPSVSEQTAIRESLGVL